MVVITSCGAVAEPASRLLKEMAVVLVVARAKLTSPLPTMSGVTSNDTHCLEAKEPEEEVALAAG